MLAVVSIFGAIFSTIDLLLRQTSRRARLAMDLEIARQNAKAALQIALGTLAAEMSGGQWITSMAGVACGNALEANRHWAGIWSVRDGAAQFSKWLVSTELPVENSLSLPTILEKPAANVFPDLALPDRCPTVEIRNNGRVHGHWGFWVGDEAAKVRVNVRRPVILSETIAQQFGNLWLKSHGLRDEQWDILPTLRSFDQLRELVPNIPAECVHAVTLSSASILQHTTGEMLVDFTAKLQRREFSEHEFLFSPPWDLPQPPPTFSLVATYLDHACNATGGTVAVRGGDDFYRQLYPPTQPCPYKLNDLPVRSAAIHVATQCPFSPVLCGFWLTVYARATEEYLILSFAPQIALWNPCAVNLGMHTYEFRCRATEAEERIVKLPALPCIVSVESTESENRFYLGNDQSGDIFCGTFSSDFGAGSVKFFSLSAAEEVHDGCWKASWSEGLAHNRWSITFPSKGAQTIHLQRINSLSVNASWSNLTLQLRDGHTGVLFHEVADFVDGDRTQNYEVPRDGIERPLFRLQATLRTGEGPFATRWIADYNPRARQIRRSLHEHFPLLGFTREERGTFLRIFPSWNVAFHDSPFAEPHLPEHLIDGAILFDVPQKIFSLAALQHLPLFPFSYHPCYVVGNSWAPPLIRRNKSWLPSTSENELARSCECVRMEMLFDASYLINAALYDHFFTGGFEKNAADGTANTSSVVVPLEGFSDKLPASERAKFLLNAGALNVNGASVDVWEIFLRSMVYDAAENTYYLPRYKGHSANIPIYPLRKLTERELDCLAECIVEEVRNRGPFPSLSAFVNRKLGDTLDPNSRCGALQRAIERAGWRNFSGNLSSDRRAQSWFDDDAASGDAHTGAPGDVSQADLLQFFGNSLTVRGDTFLLRAYGDSIGGEEESGPRAICETIIQRMPDGQLRQLYFRWICE
jgi:hypothetical protein